MIIEKNRHMILMYNLVHASGPLTAEELADLTMSSVRTVKSDVVALNQQLACINSTRIVSHKAKGYTVEAENPDDLIEIASELDIMYLLFYNRSIEAVNRRMYIVQRFLTDEYVMAEDICAELFLSKSALRRDFARAIEFLKSFRLEVTSVAGKGYHVVGREQDIRSAMVEIHCSQYHEFQPLYPYESFNQQFYFEGKNIYPEMRRALLNIIRDSEIVIYDIAGKKLATHLCLMQNRICKGKTISFSDDIADELRRTYDYKIAAEILGNKTVRKYIDADEQETLNLARLLLINRDINMRRKGIDSLLTGFVIENLSIFNKVIDRAKKHLGGLLYDLDIMKVYSRDLESLQMQIYLKNHFDYTDKRRMVTYLEGRENNVSPIAMEMSRIMIYILQDILQVPIRDEKATSFAIVLENIINKIDLPYNKRNLLVCSTNGIVTAQMLREKLLTSFGKYINTAEVYNFYELRKLDLAGYKTVLDTNLVMYNHYDTKVVAYSNLDYAADNRNLFTDLFIDGYDRSILEHIKKLMTVHQNVVVKNIDSFMEAISYRYASGMDDQKMIYDKYLMFKKILDYYSPHTGIVTFFIPMDHTGRELIDIFIPKDHAYYGESSEIKGVIVISVKPDINLFALKTLDNILKYILQVNGTLEDLREDKDGTLNRIYDAIIARDFFGR